jgi:hypothetical protein
VSDTGNSLELKNPVGTPFGLLFFRHILRFSVGSGSTFPATNGNGYGTTIPIPAATDKRHPIALPRSAFLENSPMSLNKKQKKQLDLDQKKLQQLKLQLSGAKKQLDDPEEVRRLEQDIIATQNRIDKLKAEE